VLGVSRKRSALFATAVAVVAAGVAAAAQALPSKQALPPMFALHSFKTTWSGTLTWTLAGTHHESDDTGMSMDQAASGQTTIAWNLRSEATNPWQVDVGSGKITYSGTETRHYQPPTEEPEPPTNLQVTCGGGGTVTGIGTRNGNARFKPARSRMGGAIVSLYNSRNVRVEISELFTVFGPQPKCSGDVSELGLPRSLVIEEFGRTRVVMLPASARHKKVISIPFNVTTTSKGACGVPGCLGTLKLRGVIKIYPKPRQ
jgi:hypothetical protein